MGNFEERLLLAVNFLGQDAAYGAELQRVLRDAIDCQVSLGAIYITLQRLEAKGMVRSREGGAAEVRGGRRKRLFQLTTVGRRALAAAEDTRQTLRSLGPAKPQAAKGGS